MALWWELLKVGVMVAPTVDNWVGQKVYLQVDMTVVMLAEPRGHLPVETMVDLKAMVRAGMMAVMKVVSLGVSTAEMKVDMKVLL